MKEEKKILVQKNRGLSSPVFFMSFFHIIFTLLCLPPFLCIFFVNDITTLNSNLTRLDNRLTEDEGDIVNLGNGIVALANRVTLLEGCCEEVRGVLADHNTRINKNCIM